MASVRIARADSELGTIDEADLPRALESGFRVVGADEADAIKKRREVESVGGTVRGGLEAAARGVSFGTSDALLTSLGADSEMMAARQANLGTLGSGIEVAGAAAPALFSGGAGVLGTVARATPAGRVAQLGRGVAGATERALGGGAAARVAGAAASGGFEGALQGAGSAVSQAALGDVDLTSEMVVGSMGRGAWMGGLLGGGTAATGLGLSAAYTGAKRIGRDAIEATLGGTTRAAGSSTSDNVLDALSARQIRALGGGDDVVAAGQRSLGLTRTAEGRSLLEMATTGKGVDEAVGARLSTTLPKSGAGNATRAWAKKVAASDAGRQVLSGRARSAAEALEGLQGSSASKLRSILRSESRLNAPTIEQYTVGRGKVFRVLDRMRDEGDIGLAKAEAAVQDYLGAGTDTAIWGPSIQAREAVIAGQQAEKAVLKSLPEPVRKALSSPEPLDAAMAAKIAGKHGQQVEELIAARSSVADALESAGEDVAQLRRSLDEVRDALGFRGKVGEVKADLDALDALEGGTGATARKVLETGGEVVGAVAGGLSFGGGVLGKAAGQIAGAVTRPASAIRVVARVRGGLDAVRARQAGAVAAFEKLIDSGARGVVAAGRGASAVARRAVPAVARRSGSPSERRAALISAISRIGEIASRPAEIGDKLDPREMAALAHGAPDVANAAVAATTRALVYLRSVSPPVYRSPYAPSVQLVAPEQLEAFERRLAAVQDPDAVIGLIGSGGLTAEHVEALQAVYPRRYAELVTTMRDAVGRRIAEGKPVSFDARMQLGVMGEALQDPTQQPDTYAQIQASMIDNAPAGQPPQQPPASASKIKPPPLTQWQRLEGG